MQWGVELGGLVGSNRTDLAGGIERGVDGLLDDPLLGVSLSPTPAHPRFQERGL